MAELKDQIRADMTAAMKARDKRLTTVLRSVLSAITAEEVSGQSARELSVEEELKVVNREVRKRREAAEGLPPVVEPIKPRPSWPKPSC